MAILTKVWTTTVDWQTWTRAGTKYNGEQSAPNPATVDGELILEKLTITVANPTITAVITTFAENVVIPEVAASTGQTTFADRNTFWV